MTRRVRVGVIGLGMGRTHARGYLACPDAELVAVCDIDPKRLDERSRELGVRKAYLRYREMFERENLDAVSVAVPNDLHCPITCDALNAGLHVLCEKPMAMNALEARRMCAVAKRGKRKLMIHFNYRWSPQCRLLKDLVDAGELGDVYWGRTRWLRSRGFPGLGTWFTDKKRAGGGPLIDLGVHRIDLALWLMGFPKVATVTGSTYHHLSKRMARRSKKVVTIEDLACALIRFENGATLMVEVSWDLNGERFEDQMTELYGTSGGLVHRNIEDKYEYEIRLFKEVNGRLASVVPKELPKVESTQAHFVGAILNDTPLAATGEHGLYVMEVLDAIYRSAAAGREVKVR